MKEPNSTKNECVYMSACVCECVCHKKGKRISKANLLEIFLLQKKKNY